MNSASRLSHKMKTLGLMTVGGSVVFAGLNIYNGSEKFYNEILMPTAHFLLAPEQAHNFAVFLNKHRLLPKSRFKDPETLATKFLSFEVPNPVGIAAGYDKHGESILGLKDIGFGFVEIGSITPQPQDGNPKPRVFRLPEDKAVINRYGFNSEGHEKVNERIQKIRKDQFDGVIGINLGKNKESPDPINDYVEGINKFGAQANYLVINISSPNTPGLRAFQDHENLKVLLPAVIKARDALPITSKPPILLKLAPDLTQSEKKQIADVLNQKQCKIDGLIISNTTISRTDLVNKNQNETGGLSGKPLKEASTKMVAEMYKLTNGKLPIIGAGGVFTGEDAYEKIRAGASLVQLYTSYIYHGPPLVERIKRDLDKLLTKDGFKNVSEAVGVDAKKYV